jgi:hypothetical protein
MRSFLSMAASIFILLLASYSPANAQGISGFIFASYYECDPSLEGALDAAVMSGGTTIYDRHLQSGDITAWGWSAHAIGGAWKRLSFFAAPDRASGMAARSSILESLRNEAPATVAMVNSACPKHDDYIWTVAQSSQVSDTPAGSAPFTTGYYVCQQSREAEADEAVREAWAPILEDLVREGKLSGWQWLAHDTGGIFRRAMSFTGSDHTSIMAARDELSARLADNEAASALNSACGTHSDYAWTPVTGT